ncbi:hypothetical protein SPHINGOAX6_70258 [Sphingomonas sp. AX6]|nr:hypothetical protein SPHINGOAX6_70258 [Sphingomonas sp. AX6]
MIRISDRLVVRFEDATANRKGFAGAEQLAARLHRFYRYNFQIDRSAALIQCQPTADFGQHAHFDGIQETGVIAPQNQSHCRHGLPPLNAYTARPERRSRRSEKAGRYPIVAGAR